VSNKAKRARIIKTMTVGLIGALVAIAVLTPNPWQGSREDA
jgi:uncharacterized membrane protein YeaQ/YmgE (transglycosylase-associated protein family)